MRRRQLIVTRPFAGLTVVIQSLSESGVPVRHGDQVVGDVGKFRMECYHERPYKKASDGSKRRRLAAGRASESP